MISDFRRGVGLKKIRVPKQKSLYHRGEIWDGGGRSKKDTQKSDIIYGWPLTCASFGRKSPESRQTVWAIQSSNSLLASTLAVYIITVVIVSSHGITSAFFIAAYSRIDVPVAIQTLMTSFPLNSLCTLTLSGLMITLFLKRSLGMALTIWK